MQGVHSCTLPQFNKTSGSAPNNPSPDPPDRLAP